MSDTSSPSSSDGEVEGMPSTMHDISISDLIFEDSSFARGAFGRMVKADYFGVTVCVKILKKQRKKELAKFVAREMAALKTLSHPNLVQFIGVTEKGNEICLVTEFISGGTLRQLLKDRTIPVAWHVRVQFAVDISSAMTYLHSRKIMHRDLKSKNLLVGDNGKIKICDFGFARSIHDKKKNNALTFCGTEEYMAPEVIFGMEYDERAEVYSYGLLLCEIITRAKVEETVPRTSNTNYGLDHQEFVAHVPKDCPNELVQLAFLCTEFEPKNRPEFREITQILREIKQTVNASSSPLLNPMSPQVPRGMSPLTLQATPPTMQRSGSPAIVNFNAPLPAPPTDMPLPPVPAPVPASLPPMLPPPVAQAPVTTPLPPPPTAPVEIPVPVQARSPPAQIPPPLQVEEDANGKFLPIDKHAQNGNNAKATGSSPPSRTLAPVAPLRRSPSAPIPMPAPNQLHGTKEAPPAKPGAKATPKEAPSKAGAPGKKAPPPLVKSNSAKFEIAQPTSSPVKKGPQRVPSAQKLTFVPTSKSPPPTAVPPRVVVSPTPSSAPSKAGGVPALPKLPASAAVASPNTSPRSAKDRPISPMAKPAPPGRGGRHLIAVDATSEKRR